MFAVCGDAAVEVCPVRPGQPVSAHRGAPDPTAAGGDEAGVAAVFVDALRMLNLRIGIFVDPPFAPPDRPGLPRSLAGIGTRTGDGAP